MPPTIGGAVPSIPIGRYRLAPARAMSSGVMNMPFSDIPARCARRLNLAISSAHFSGGTLAIRLALSSMTLRTPFAVRRFFSASRLACLASNAAATRSASSPSPYDDAPERRYCGIDMPFASASLARLGTPVPFVASISACAAAITSGSARRPTPRNCDARLRRKSSANATSFWSIRMIAARTVGFWTSSGRMRPPRTASIACPACGSAKPPWSHSCGAVVGTSPATDAFAAIVVFHWPIASPCWYPDAGPRSFG